MKPPRRRRQHQWRVLYPECSAGCLASSLINISLTIMNEQLHIFRAALSSSFHSPSPWLWFFCSTMLLSWWQGTGLWPSFWESAFPKPLGPWLQTRMPGPLPTCPPCSTIRKTGHPRAWEFIKGLLRAGLGKSDEAEVQRIGCWGEKKWWEWVISSGHFFREMIPQVSCKKVRR